MVGIENNKANIKHTVYKDDCAFAFYKLYFYILYINGNDGNCCLVVTWYTVRTWSN